MDSLDTLFKEYYQNKLDALKERYTITKNKHKHKTLRAILNPFLRIIDFERRNLVTKYEPNDPFASSYKTQDNRLKKALLEEFKYCNDYIENKTFYFFQEKVPMLKESYYKSFEKFYTKENEWEPEYANATNEQIIFFLAECIAYEDFESFLEKELYNFDKDQKTSEEFLQNNKIKDIEAYVSQSKIEKAIDSLIKFLEPLDKNLYNNAIIISSRFSEYKKEKLLGTIPYKESNEEMNQIRKAILDLLNLSQNERQ